MTTKQILADYDKRINYLEKAYVNLESKIIYKEAKENVRKGDVELIGNASATISLEDLKSTIKVLENYKKQGITAIVL